MTYTTADLEALQQALISSEQRGSFGDKTAEYRSVAELQAAIRTVTAALARNQGRALARQNRVTTSEGFRWPG
jgi:hypothetical protein